MFFHNVLPIARQQSWIEEIFKSIHLRPKTPQSSHLTFALGWTAIPRSAVGRRIPICAKTCGWSREMKNVDFLIPPASRDSQNIPQVDASDFLVTLMAMAGHDLRQPLQLITSAHDIITTMPLAKHERRELAQAAAAVTKLARMLDQLVEVVQLHERGRDDLAAPVPLGPILADLTAEFEAAARLKGVHFRIANSQDVVLSHPVLLTAMLRNLVRNAIDYTPAAGSVSITARQRGPELHITVRDTGPGIHAAALSKISNAFERADESRPDGFGLGLFIVKRAGDLLGHTIDVQSIEGCGSCVTVRAIRADCSRMKLVA